MTHPKSRRKAEAAKSHAKIVPTIMANAKEGHLVKARELIEFRVTGLEKLTKHDLHIENLLLQSAMIDLKANPWKPPEWFDIPIAALKGSHNGLGRIDASLTRLQGTSMQVLDPNGSALSVPKLGDWMRGQRHGVPDGILRYNYTLKYISMIQMSSLFGVLDVDTMAQLPSKYAYRMYEVVARRARLTHMRSERLSVEYMREVVLGVPKGKLTTPSDLLRRAIDPAVVAVNATGSFKVNVTPQIERRQTVGYRLDWA